MLALRANGWSFNSLYLLYGCDRKTIEAQCRKYKVSPPESVFTIERIGVSTIKPDDDMWHVVEGERINRGLNYSDYLARYSHRK